MKLAHCLALMALIFVVVVTSINCVQNNTPQPSPTVSPSGTPSGTPTAVPTPSGSLTWNQQLDIYNTAIQDPYVRDSVLKTAWRNTQEIGGQYVINTGYIMGQVGYMSFHEYGPDYDRVRVLPAAEIVPGNISQAGINVIAFVDPDRKRVAYIGFVPRPGVEPAPGVTFTSADNGVDEYEPLWGASKPYFNVTIVDTGYAKGMSLTDSQKDQMSMLAMTNATVRGLIGSHSPSASNFTMQSYETGFQYRYIIAYPMVTIDVTDAGVRYAPVYALIDVNNNRVVRVESGEPPII
jgi:hypothetical protein